MLKNRSSLSSLAVALAAFGLYSLVGAASASDIAKVRIISAQGEEAVEVDLDALKVGDSRQLVAASGKPAVVSRSEQGLRIELAGKVTEVTLAPVELREIAHADGKQVRVIKLDGKHAGFHGDAHDQAHGDGQQKHQQHGEREVVIVRHHGEAGDAAISEEEVASWVAEAEAGLDSAVLDGNGDKVIVTREIRRQQPAADAR